MPKFRKQQLQATSPQHNQAMSQSIEASSAPSRKTRLCSKISKILPMRLNNSRTRDLDSLQAPKSRKVSTIQRIKNKVSNLIRPISGKQDSNVATCSSFDPCHVVPECDQEDCSGTFVTELDSEIAPAVPLGQTSRALIVYRQPEHMFLPKPRMLGLAFIPQISRFLEGQMSRLLFCNGPLQRLEAYKPKFSDPDTLAKLQSGVEIIQPMAPYRQLLMERASVPVQARSRRPMSYAVISHARNLSDASTVAENQDHVTSTLFAPRLILDDMLGHHSEPINAFCKQLLSRCATLATELTKYKPAPVAQKKIVTVVPGLENEVQKLEALFNHGAGHAIGMREAPRRVVDRLAAVCQRVVTEGLAANNLNARQADHIRFLSQTVLVLNEQLQHQVVAVNQQAEMTAHLAALYDELRDTAIFQLNQQIVATNNVAAQYEHLRQTAAVDLQAANRRYDEVVAEHAQRIEQWSFLHERSMLEKADTLAQLREAREEVERVMPTVELLQENVETFEKAAEAASVREKAAREENENLRNVLWAKTKQLEESERALKMSQSLHQKDVERAQQLSKELRELRAQNETDIQVAAAKILETEAQVKAEQDVNMALTQQNTLLRGVFRQKVDSERVSASDDIRVISSGMPNVDLLLSANQQQEGLVKWLERELSYASWTRYAAKDLEDQLAVNHQQKVLIEELKEKNKELDEKIFTEEISNANTSERLQQSESYIVQLANRLEEVNHELGQTKEAVIQLSKTNKQLLGQRLSREQLIRAEGWIVERLQAHLELKEEEIAALTNQAASHAEETERVKEIAGMNIDLLRDQMYGARYTMGNTIIFAEANYRERNEAYAKLRAFEKRFADELAVEPLVPEPIYIAPFDEVAPQDFKERREAAWRWAGGENEHLEGIESKVWYNLTPNDIHCIRAAHGVPPADVLQQAQIQLEWAGEQAEDEVEESMAKASEDLQGLVIGEDASDQDWVTESSPGHVTALPASAVTDPDMF